MAKTSFLFRFYINVCFRLSFALSSLHLVFLFSFFYLILNVYWDLNNFRNVDTQKWKCLALAFMVRLLIVCFLLCYYYYCVSHCIVAKIKETKQQQHSFRHSIGHRTLNTKEWVRSYTTTPIFEFVAVCILTCGFYQNLWSSGCSRFLSMWFGLEVQGVSLENLCSTRKSKRMSC